ncbi:Dabb family protein [Saccharopolyspora sp. WRP15-2]|uniref:Dabb family protein n=1 Tax=Saccharopolyspora oryzae TaxID=2997343 RepID=A0ABT4V1H7_9PSEU|nr:Dabb family protein [Saccharopolyspora oryzae]MDA3627301.1 Dabb family protein [Saccharopolyspora oryzae]
MIILMLRFALRPGTTQAETAAVLAAMRRTATLDSVSFSAVGQDLGDPADGYTHAYCAGVRDLAALRRYLYDPVHLDGDLEILPHLARLSALQLSDDMDPGLKEKIVAMHREKVAAYPEWGRLLDTIPR